MKKERKSDAGLGSKLTGLSFKLLATSVLLVILPVIATLLLTAYANRKLSTIRRVHRRSIDPVRESVKQARNDIVNTHNRIHTGLRRGRETIDKAVEKIRQQQASAVASQLAAMVRAAPKEANFEPSKIPDLDTYLLQAKVGPDSLNFLIIHEPDTLDPKGRVTDQGANIIALHHKFSLIGKSLEALNLPWSNSVLNLMISSEWKEKLRKKVGAESDFTGSRRPFEGQSFDPHTKGDKSDKDKDTAPIYWTLTFVGRYGGKM
jgi:hypothetical protein